jgi:formylglycine-generating enzyme
MSLVISSCVTGPPKLTAPHIVFREAEMRAQIFDRSAEFRRLDGDGDGDGDGMLTAQEYNGTVKLFEDMDVDQNGLLSPEEAKYMVTFAELPAGTFVMGTNVPIRAFFEPATDALPAHEVHISAFKMGTTEITTAQYCMYLNSALKAGEISVLLGDIANDQTRVFRSVSGHVVEGARGTKYEGKPFMYLSPITALSHIYAFNSPLLIPEHPLNQAWISYIPEIEKFIVDPGFDDWPASFLKWWGAMAFAEYYDLTLPTEAEWEYVARAGAQLEFPTADGNNSGKLSNYKCYNVLGTPNFTGDDSPEDFIGFRIDVGSYHPNPFGVYDMAGSVWEWTLDWYDAEIYQYRVDNGILTNPLNFRTRDKAI